MAKTLDKTLMFCYIVNSGCCITAWLGVILNIMKNMKQIEKIKTWLGTGSINIFGIQFSGKDTVGERLAEVLDAEFVSSGDIVRSARKKSDDEQIKKAAKITDSGVMMPMDEYKELICSHLRNDAPIDRALVLSSVGRWIGEEGPVMEALKEGGHDTKAVILLKISQEEVFARWEIVGGSRNDGRVDDINKEKVLRRLDEFRNKTLPVIDIYRKMGILIEINGEQSREEVFDEVINKLYDFSRKSTS